MNIGILTGGGDVPGLNAVIRAAVAKASELGHKLIGIRDGWRGALTGYGRTLTWYDVSDLVGVGGTTLGSSRTNPAAEPDGISRVMASLTEMNVDGLIAVGGDDTLGVAKQLAAAGFPTVGVPKTMDNDVAGTDYTIGFFTAAGTATGAAERLRTTARSHRRLMILEVMGRHAGWVALAAGLGAGADLTLIPELPADIDDVSERLAEHCRRHEHAVVVVAEGVKVGGEFAATGETDAFGHVRLGGAGQRIADEIAKRTGLETRASVLGHIQRGGPAVLYDRLLGSALGTFAVEMLDRGVYGHMAAWRSERAVAVSLEEALAAPKLVPDAWVDVLCTLQQALGC